MDNDSVERTFNLFHYHVLYEETSFDLYFLFFYKLNIWSCMEITKYSNYLEII